MKKIFILSVFFFFLFLFIGKHYSYAIDCNNRPSSCPKSTYPKCTMLGSKHTACPPSNSGGINPCTFSEGRADYCAYVIDPSVKFSCNATHQCVTDTNGTLDSTCNGGCVSTPPGDTGTGGSIGTWGSPGSGPSLYSISNILGGGAPNNAPTTGYEALIKLFLNILIVTAIVLFVIFFIWGGISWIMSGGDKQKLQSSKQKLTFSIIGLVVVFTAVIIINFLFTFLRSI